VGDLSKDLEKKSLDSKAVKEEYTVGDLLKDIGLPEQAEYYKGKTFVYDYARIGG
jgi:hypothetical protein